LPFQTIKYALTIAKLLGNTVNLRAGTYRELATFPYSGNAAAPNYLGSILSGILFGNNLIIPEV